MLVTDKESQSSASDHLGMQVSSDKSSSPVPPYLAFRDVHMRSLDVHRWGLSVPEQASQLVYYSQSSNEVLAP